MNQTPAGPVIKLELDLAAVTLIVRGLRKLPVEEVESLLTGIVEFSKQKATEFDAAQKAASAPPAAATTQAAAPAASTGRTAASFARTTKTTKKTGRKPGRPKKTAVATAASAAPAAAGDPVLA